MQLEIDLDDSNALSAKAQPGQGGDGTNSPRVKTRLLHRGNPCRAGGDDIFEQMDKSAISARNPSRGGITVIGGPERGRVFELTEQYMRIGRGESQEIQLLDDGAVSRESHAIIGFVPDFSRFIIIDGGKVNPVLVNGAVLQDAAFLEDGDIIKIGDSAMYLTAY